MAYYPFYAIFDHAPDPDALLLQLPDRGDVIVLDPVQGELVSGEFEEFEATLYDGDGPSPDQIQERRQLGYDLVESLVRAGARLAYISGAADNYAGEPGHNELAEQIHLSLDETPALSKLLSSPFYFWLVAAPSSGPLHDLVASRKRATIRSDQGIVIAEEPGGPLFLEW